MKDPLSYLPTRTVEQFGFIQKNHITRFTSRSLTDSTKANENIGFMLKNQVQVCKILSLMFQCSLRQHATITFVKKKAQNIRLNQNFKCNRCYELNLMTNSDFTLQHRFTSQSLYLSLYPPNYKALSSMILTYEEDFYVAPLVQFG